MHDALADRSRVVYDPYTPEQQQGIRRQLEKFVAAQVMMRDRKWGAGKRACSYLCVHHSIYCTYRLMPERPNVGITCQSTCPRSTRYTKSR